MLQADPRQWLAGSLVSPGFLGVPFLGTGLVPALTPQGPGHPKPAESPEVRPWRVSLFTLSFFIQSLLVLVQALLGSLGGGSYGVLCWGLSDPGVPVESGKQGKGGGREGLPWE